MGGVKFSGSIAEIYERILVPIMFGPFADDLVKRVEGDRILELAAGTGALTRRLTERLPSAKIVATDLNSPMLEKITGVETRVADANALPFDDGSFDVVVCQFGVMFFDRARAYREAKRVAGRFVFNTWGPIEAHDFENAIVGEITKLGIPVTFLRRIPHGYCDPDVIRADLRAAGYTKIAIDEVRVRGKARSREEVAVGWCQGTPMRNEIPPERLDATIAAIQNAVPIEGEMLAYAVVAS